MSIHYQIRPLTKQHVYQVKLVFIATDTIHQIKLPTWIPGSYMIREFSKNIINIDAQCNSAATSLVQLSKNCWEVSAIVGAQISIEYQVYAYEYGIRTAFLDDERGYFNNSSLCLYVVGQEHLTHQIQLIDLPSNWQIASGLVARETNCLVAQNYAELIDCPVELGNFVTYEFTANEVKHKLILSGSVLQFDSQRLLSDMQRICSYQINLFGGKVPYTDYTFILNLSGEIYTGLEHRNSTLLMAPYYALPNLAKTNDQDYIKLLGLISHEFFHTWNVKRIKPAVFAPYDLDQENYTRLLWWFEGVTSYYDDLVLYRTGIIDQQQYLQLIVDNINNVYKFAGAANQSLADSSFNSWIKYYRPDENSPNANVSYYVKGALVAMCLDLLIRKGSQFSLDDVIAAMYSQAKNDEFIIAENDLAKFIWQITKLELSDFLDSAINTTEPLAFAELFAVFGLQLNTRFGAHLDSGKIITDQSIEPSLSEIASSASTRVLDLGFKFSKTDSGLLVNNVYVDSPASKAGLAAGDVILAINSVKADDLVRQLKFFEANDSISLTFFRREKLLTLTLQPEYQKVVIHDLQISDNNLLANWLD